jgi:hypothetical protein
MSDFPKYQGTGIPPKQAQHFATVGPAHSMPSVQEAQTTEKEKVELWFIELLEAMSGHDAFVCLMVCFPLLEAIARYEFNIPDDQDLSLRGHEKVLHWFAAFMKIPEAQASEVWDSFRNGMLHRAMVKSDMPYQLTGDRRGRPAEFKDGTLFIYVWDFRDAVVALLQKYHRKLWAGQSSQLAKIHIRA